MSLYIFMTIKNKNSILHYSDLKTSLVSEMTGFLKCSSNAISEQKVFWMQNYETVSQMLLDNIYKLYHLNQVLW